MTGDDLRDRAANGLSALREHKRRLTLEMARCDAGIMALEELTRTPTADDIFQAQEEAAERLRKAAALHPNNEGYRQVAESLAAGARSFADLMGPTDAVPGRSPDGLHSDEASGTAVAKGIWDVFNPDAPPTYSLQREHPYVVAHIATTTAAASETSARAAPPSPHVAEKTQPKETGAGIDRTGASREEVEEKPPAQATAQPQEQRNAVPVGESQGEAMTPLPDAPTKPLTLREEILQCWNDGMQDRKTLAQHLGRTAATIDNYLYLLRKEGKIPPAKGRVAASDRGKPTPG